MRRNITLFTASSLLFLLLLGISGSVSGVLSDVIYFLAFLLPVILGAALGKPKPCDENGESTQPSPIEYLKLGREEAGLLAPCLFPTVAAVFLLSYLTSLLIYVTMGVSDTVEVGDNLLLAIITHAVLPAVLEEALFRFLPIHLLSGYSKRVTVLFSALYFALVHNSFFSIPYAFAAGLIFITLDLMCGSVWPSVILHLLNNLISVLWIFYSESQGFVIAFSVSLGVLALSSLAVIWVMRKRYLNRLSGMFSQDEKYIFGYEPLMLIIPTLIFAATEFM